MSRRMHGVFLSLKFPAGIAPGEGSDYNTLTIARNGNDEPLLRGTALAGALRHAWTRQRIDAGYDKHQANVEANFFFGFTAEDESNDYRESRLKVADAVIKTSADAANGKQPTVTRTYHLRNRHTGAVVDGGLFSLEACPKGSTADIAFWFCDEEESSDRASEFLQTLVLLLNSGLTLGGNAARGIGSVQLGDTPPCHRAYELTDATEHAQFLDDHRQWRRLERRIPDGAQTIDVKAMETPKNLLTVTFTLAIPRGQDVLIGDGQGVNSGIEPQRVLAADGKEYWRLPGASLRGMFRGWVARLAAREGKTLADDAQRHDDEMNAQFDGSDNGIAAHRKLTGANLGWSFLEEKYRNHDEAQKHATDCPVANLFGTLFQVGRIHIGDAYSECSSSDDEQKKVEEQKRMHVAVDRITGGAAESMLFENTVLTAPPGAAPKFAVTMRVKNPSEDEARWLAQTLLALHLGILRVGSSKSSGRLEIIELNVDGQGSEKFEKAKVKFEELKPKLATLAQT